MGPYPPRNMDSMCNLLRDLFNSFKNSVARHCEVKSGECKTYCEKYCDHFYQGGWKMNCPKFENENEGNKTENILNTNNYIDLYLANFIKGNDNCMAVD